MVYMLTCIIANDGTKLMPTTNIKKVRKLLKTKKANIVCYHPFTIQLSYNPTSEIVLQPIELSMNDKDIKPPIVKTDKVKPFYHSGGWVLIEK